MIVNLAFPCLLILVLYLAKAKCPLSGSNFRLACALLLFGSTNSNLSRPDSIYRSAAALDIIVAALDKIVALGSSPKLLGSSPLLGSLLGSSLVLRLKLLGSSPLLGSSLCLVLRLGSPSCFKFFADVCSVPNARTSSYELQTLILVMCPALLMQTTAFHLSASNLSQFLVV
jgi:hypothetical protein